jgi:hypothetical protein
MSRAAVALILFLSALPILAQQSPPACQNVKERDPETGVVVQKTRLAPKAASFVPLLIWASDDPDSVMLAVMGNSSAPKYSKCQRLTLQADGQPVILSPARYDGSTSGAMVVEYLTSDIAWSEAEKLLNAKAITYRICDDPFQANEEFVCQARKVIEGAAAWRKNQAAKK